MIIFLSPDNTSLWFMCEILRREESKAEYKQVKIGVFLRQFITTISSGISQKNDVSNTSRGLFFVHSHVDLSMYDDFDRAKSKFD